MINWNTVPAFYNDSYTYMEWLGKVTAKVEDHEARLTQAEQDINSLEERMDEAEADIDVLEGRMDTAEADIDALEGRMDTAEADIDALEGRMDTAEADIDALQPVVTELYNWYDNTASDAVEYVVTVRQQLTTALTTTIPALQEQTAENAAAIIELQRGGAINYQDITSTLTSSSTGTRINISATYTGLSPAETEIDLALQFTLRYNNTNYVFYTRDFVHIPGGSARYNVSPDAAIKYTVGVNFAGGITFSITDVIIGGTAVDISDVTAQYLSRAEIMLIRAKTVTPTSEKEAYQASVRIFTDKTIPLDNRTASIIMQYYSAASTDPSLTWASWAADYNTEHPEGLQLDTTVEPDTNKDGKINAIDATNVMTYYSNVSAGRTQYVNSDADKFYQWYLDGNPPQWEY